MTYVLTPQTDGTTRIHVDFADEDVVLVGDTSVKGGTKEALAYLPVFTSDLQRNFVDLFLLPIDAPIQTEFEVLKGSVKPREVFVRGL